MFAEHFVANEISDRFY